jgi:hypothetical protein
MSAAELCMAASEGTPGICARPHVGHGLQDQATTSKHMLRYPAVYHTHTCVYLIRLHPHAVLSVSDSMCRVYPLCL